MLMKTKKKNRKNLTTKNFEKGKKKTSGDMVDSELHKKFDLNHRAVSEKPELTAGCLRHDSISADKVQQS